MAVNHIEVTTSRKLRAPAPLDAKYLVADATAENALIISDEIYTGMMIFRQDLIQIRVFDGNDFLPVITSGIGEAPQDGTPYSRQDAAWVSSPDGSPAGNDTEVQFNNAGAFGASNLFTYNGTTFFIGAAGVSGVDNIAITKESLDMRVVAGRSASIGGFGGVGTFSLYNQGTENLRLSGGGGASAMWIKTDDGLAIGPSAVGGAAAGTLLDVDGTTSMKLPLGTGAQQPTGIEGMLRGNSEDNVPEYYTGTGWLQLGGAGSSPLTTKGDLYGFSTVDARLPLGADNLVLTADAAESTGLKWAPAPAGNPAGGDTQLQFNDGGVFGATTNLTWVDVVKVFRIGGSGSSYTFGTGNKLTIDDVPSNNERATIGLGPSSHGEMTLDSTSNFTHVLLTGNNTGISYISSRLGLGTFTPNAGAQLHVGNTNSMIIPLGTTAQRPAAIEGMFRGNSDDNVPEYYTGTEWLQLGGGGGGTPGGSDREIQFNDGGSTFGATSNFVYNENVPDGGFAFIIGATANGGALAYNGLLIDITETSGALITNNRLLDVRGGGVQRLAVTNNGSIVITSSGGGAIEQQTPQSTEIINKFSNSNSGASANIGFRLITGSTGGDPYMQFGAGPVASPDFTYAIGVDNSDDNKYKLVYNTGVATPSLGTTLYEVTTAGLFTFNSNVGGGGTVNFLRADGAWDVPAASAAGSDTEIQFNNSGALGTDAGLTWNSGLFRVGTAGGLRVDTANDSVNVYNSSGLRVSTLGLITNNGFLQLENSSSTTTLQLSGDNTADEQASFISTHSIKIPIGTTGERPTNVIGRMRFNNTLSVFEGYDGTAWTPFGGGGGGGTPAGADTQLQFNNAGAFGADTNLTWDGTGLSVGGALTAGNFFDVHGATTSKFGVKEAYTYVQGEEVNETELRMVKTSTKANGDTYTLSSYFGTTDFGAQMQFKVNDATGSITQSSVEFLVKEAGSFSTPLIIINNALNLIQRTTDPTSGPGTSRFHLYFKPGGKLFTQDSGLTVREIADLNSTQTMGGKTMDIPKMSNVPTSDPAISGAVWSNGGVLTLSP